MREPARVARMAGFEVDEANHAQPDASYDVMVFQRVGHPAAVESIPKIQATGTAVVVDMDDDMTCLDPAHPSFYEFHPRYGRWSHRTMAKACALADLVTVTSPALARRYAAHGRVAVLPNCVPEKLLDMPRSSDGRTVGCTTNPINHPGDLEVMRAGLSMALEQTGARLEHLGAQEEVWEPIRLGLGVPEDRFQALGVMEFDDYWQALGRFDVGIAPLRDTAFNAAKSYLKPLEFMARGVAWVGSPRAEYQWLQRDASVGLLAADRARSWRSALTWALGDGDWRKEQTERGRAYVAEHATLEGQGWRWQEAWDLAASNRKRRAAGRGTRLSVHRLVAA